MTSVTVENDHVFATVGGITLGLDLYRAPQADTPLVLYVHGGGWRGGDKADVRADRIAPMAALGVTVASANYRLEPAARGCSQPASATTPAARPNHARCRRATPDVRDPDDRHR